MTEVELLLEENAALRQALADLVVYVEAQTVSTTPPGSDACLFRARDLLIKLIVRDWGAVVRSPPAQRYAEECARRFLGQH